MNLSSVVKLPVLVESELDSFRLQFKLITLHSVFNLDKIINVFVVNSDARLEGYLKKIK